MTNLEATVPRWADRHPRAKRQSPGDKYERDQRGEFKVVQIVTSTSLV